MRHRKRNGYGLAGLLRLILGFAILYQFVMVTTGNGGRLPYSDPSDFSRVYVLIWVVIALGVAVLVGITVYRKYRLSRAGIAEIDLMSGEKFEEKLTVLFSHLGYQATHTGRSNDFGVDLIVRKDGKSTAVQAKRYNPFKERVHESAIQEVFSGAQYYRCDNALVVTTSTYTPAAIQLARRIHVTLWDRNMLIDALLKERAVIDKKPMIPGGNFPH